MYKTPTELTDFADFLQFDCGIIVYDLETTGLNPKPKGQDPASVIIQLSAVKLDHIYLEGFSIVAEREWYIKPLQAIPEKIVELTGITDEFLEDKPSEGEVFEEIREFFDGYAVAGYNNTSFDDIFMKEMYERYGCIFDPFLSVDVYKLGDFFVGPGDVPDRKLKTMAAFYGMDDVMFHNASGDTEVTRKILELYEQTLNQRLIKTGSMIPSYDSGIKVKVTNVSKYQKDKMKRIYVNTADPDVTFYMDAYKLEWRCKKKEQSTSVFNMPDMVSQALKLAGVQTEKELAKIK